MFNVLTEPNIATYTIPKRADSLLGIFYIVSYWSHYTSLLLVYWLSETTAGTTTNMHGIIVVIQLRKSVLKEKYLTHGVVVINC